MTRHSKQHAAFLSADERAKMASAAGGTRTTRLDADAQLAFDCCALCLDLLSDPVASPHGSLFCRGCILANLLAQRVAIDEARRAWDERAAADGDASAAAASAVAAASADRFARDEASATPAFGGGAGGAGGGAAPRPAVDVPRARLDERDEAQKRAAVAKASPWAPGATPLASAAGVRALSAGARPGGSTVDPVTGAPLRAKQLIALHLTPSPDARDGEGSGGGEDTSGGASGGGSGLQSTLGAASRAPLSRGSVARFGCPGCLKAIVFQKATLLARCGHVCCASCVAAFVAKSGACIVCTKPCCSADFVALAQGGSSFAGHAATQAEARKLTAPAMAV